MALQKSSIRIFIFVQEFRREKDVMDPRKEGSDENDCIDAGQNEPAD